MDEGRGSQSPAPLVFYSLAIQQFGQRGDVCLRMPRGPHPPPLPPEGGGMGGGSTPLVRPAPSHTSLRPGSGRCRREMEMALRAEPAINLPRDGGGGEPRRAGGGAGSRNRAEAGDAKPSPIIG